MSASPTAAITVSGLVKRYNGRTVVNDVDLHVEPGEIVALLGPNGAGKTTTVECIEGFRRPDGGTVHVVGFDPVTERDEVTAVLGVMLQEGGVWQSATPTEVLNTYRKFFPAAERTEALLTQVGLDEVASTRFRYLSGGQKQRLNLALALVGRPRVVVLDEPTTGMDPEVRRATWAFIRGLADDGVAVLLTTHFMEEAEVLADRVAIMSSGRIVASGSTTEIIATHTPRGVSFHTASGFNTAALLSTLRDNGVADASSTIVPDRTGVWRFTSSVSTVSDTAVIASIAAWCADNDVAVTSITAVGQGLEAAYFALTNASEQTTADQNTAATLSVAAHSRSETRDA